MEHRIENELNLDFIVHTKNVSVIILFLNQEFVGEGTHRKRGTNECGQTLKEISIKNLK